MDWEDDDEKTTVYDTAEPEPQPAPRPAAGTPAPVGVSSSVLLPPAPVARPVTMASAPAATLAPLAPRTAANLPAMAPPPATTPEPPPRSAKSSALLGIGIASTLAAAAAAAAFFLIPSSSKLIVQLTGVERLPVAAATMLVDGKVATCQGTLCSAELTPGLKAVSLSVPGYKDVNVPVQIKPGEDAVEALQLTPLSNGTGFKIKTTAQGLSLFVDGRKVGPVPRVVKDLKPGTYDVKIGGNDLFEAWEQRVQVASDTLVDLDVTPKVKTGVASVELGKNADGARLVIECGDKRYELKDLSKGVKLPNDGTCQFVASKKDYEDISVPVAFDVGEPRKTFEVSFPDEATQPASVKAPAKKARAPRRAKRRSTAKPSRAPKARAVTPPPKVQEKATAQGTLNINSIPPSAVMLDGRPIGKTPQIGVKVSPGKHTVTFMHRDLGRRTKHVNVSAGKRATAVVNFKR